MRLSATALVEGYRRREFSPVEVMREVIARVEAYEPHIHATYLFAPDRALAEAQASTARWAKGEPKGPLDGVPVTIKDNIATRGEPKPLGTAASDLTPAASTRRRRRACARRARSLFAKTTMPDYGMLSSGLSSFHALARNPWDLSRNPGGSSAGAGAAGAAGYGPLHLGTDIGGSIRLPAGWCGLVGLKPSAGRVPIDPPYIGRVAGPMTRNVEDAALMMATLSLPDARDYTSLPPEKLDWQRRAGAAQGRADRARRRDRLRRAARSGGARGASSARRAISPAPGAIVEPVGPISPPGDARRARPVLAHALDDGHGRAARGEAREGAAVHPRLGGIGARPFRRDGVLRLQPHSGIRRDRRHGDGAVRFPADRRPRR